MIPPLRAPNLKDYLDTLAMVEIYPALRSENPLLPRFERMRPYQKPPFQYSTG